MSVSTESLLDGSAFLVSSSIQDSVAVGVPDLVDREPPGNQLLCSKITNVQRDVNFTLPKSDSSELIVGEEGLHFVHREEPWSRSNILAELQDYGSRR